MPGVSRVAEPISAAQCLGNTAPKKHRGGGDTLSDLIGPGIEPQTFRADGDVFNHYANQSVH